MSSAARESHHRAIKRILAAFEKVEAADPVEVLIKLELCESSWSRLQTNHYEIIADVVEEDDIAKHENYLIEAEETFVRTKMTLRKLIEVKAENLQRIVEEPVLENLLPERCKITPFYGEFTKWQEFRDMFLAMVDARPISNVEKLQYLKNAVKGSAASILSSWQLSGNNYVAAWQSLCDVYEDEYLIVKAHLDRLFAMPHVPDAYDAIRSTIDTTNEAVRSLDALGIPVEHWDTILVYMLEVRFSANLKEAWDFKRPTEGLPTLKDMLVFLGSRARAKANTNGNSVATTSRSSVFDCLSADDGPTKAPKSRKEEHCFMCRSSHNLYRCSDFLKLSTRAREHKVNEWRLCGNCLRPGHRPSECKSGMCRTCRQPHNNVLCPARSERQPAVASVVCAPTTSSASHED